MLRYVIRYLVTDTEILLARTRNTIPQGDLIPTVGRIAFLIGSLALLAEIALVGLQRRRPALADITNKM